MQIGKIPKVRNRKVEREERKNKKTMKLLKKIYSNKVAQIKELIFNLKAYVKNYVCHLWLKR